RRIRFVRPRPKQQTHQPQARIQFDLSAGSWPSHEVRQHHPKRRLAARVGAVLLLVPVLVGLGFRLWATMNVSEPHTNRVSVPNAQKELDFAPVLPCWTPPDVDPTAVATL